jgi:hypothetical protein
MLRDLEEEDLLGYVQSSRPRDAEHTRTPESGGKLRYKLQEQSWTLDAIRFYCAAVRQLARNLDQAELHSLGFIRFRDFVRTYTASDGFIALESGARDLKAELSHIR